MGGSVRGDSVRGWKGERDMRRKAEREGCRDGRTEGWRQRGEECQVTLLHAVDHPWDLTSLSNTAPVHC